MTARISQLKTETVDAGKAQKNHLWFASCIERRCVRRWGGVPSGPNLPRERVTKEPVKGEVLEWKAELVHLQFAKFLNMSWRKPSAG